jgi:rubrerythrin
MIMAENGNHHGDNDFEILKACRDIEKVAEEIYRYYAEIFKDNPRIRSLWERTADEEKSHAQQFELALKLRKGMVEGSSGDSFMVCNTLKYLRSFQDGIKKRKPVLSEALRSAIRFEEHLAQFHLSCIAIFRDERFKNMFTAMMASDNEHVESLQNEYENLLHNQHNPVSMETSSHL